jgi:hypothetical protein
MQRPSTIEERGENVQNRAKNSRAAKGLQDIRNGRAQHNVV